jgi:hypothetical protein
MAVSEPLHAKRQLLLVAASKTDRALRALHVDVYVHV